VTEPIVVEVGPTLGLDLPSVGLGLARGDGPPSDRETELLTALRPAHLRVDLDLARDDWQHELTRAAATARSAATGLELALALGSDPEAGLEALASALPLAQARIVRILGFEGDRPMVEPSLVRLVRATLAPCAPGAPVAGDTDGRAEPFDRHAVPPDEVDAVVRAIASEPGDGVSPLESAGRHGDTVRAAQALRPGVPVAVGPVTMPGDAPQRSGAAWTLASLASLARAGAASVTYLETTGPSGVLGPGPGSVSSPYHVLADVQEWDYGQVGESRTSTSSLAVLRAHTLDGPRILLANLTAEPRRCSIGPVAGEEVAVRVLDESTAASASDEPERFRSGYALQPTRGEALELELGPYAFARVDA
jgi:hypothetical protein